MVLVNAMLDGEVHTVNDLDALELELTVLVMENVMEPHTNANVIVAGLEQDAIFLTALEIQIVLEKVPS